ncbi:MAG: energy-coupling factor ABC transporter permease [Oscillospiraceae bacterium]|jgi:cobalt/nickel transport system permease protein|nr:energy-coupling factor ABC transporter permease [Oscillospiraceae bacterium]
MHMADALLSPAVGIAMDAVAVAAIGYSAAKVKKDELSDKKIPLIGVAGAMVFAGQMINFTIPGTGSSGHIGGGILLAGLLGGFPAFLAITAVLIIQCLFFADGGLLALGCNIFNMGVIPCLLVYPLLFKPLISKNLGAKRLSIASIIAVIVGLEVGAFAVVLETTASGITELPFGTFSGLMLPIHLAIGSIEGVVTAGVLCFVYKMRPEIISSATGGQRLTGVPVKKPLIALVCLTLVVGGALSIFASSNPDGLEWAMGKTSAEELEADNAVANGAAAVQDSTAFLPDYALASDPENPVGTTVSGLVGAGITFALAAAAGLGISAVKKRKKASVSA